MRQSFVITFPCPHNILCDPTQYRALCVAQYAVIIARVVVIKWHPPQRAIVICPPTPFPLSPLLRQSAFVASDRLLSEKVGLLIAIGLHSFGFNLHVGLSCRTSCINFGPHQPLNFFFLVRQGTTHLEEGVKGEESYSGMSVRTAHNNEPRDQQPPRRRDDIVTMTNEGCQGAKRTMESARMEGQRMYRSVKCNGGRQWT